MDPSMLTQLWLLADWRPSWDLSVASLTKRCPVDSQLPGPSPGAPTSFDVEAVLLERGSEPGGSSARIGCVVLGVGAWG
jgi:hypothetical protein